jgi:hypothetical protein
VAVNTCIYRNGHRVKITSNKRIIVLIQAYDYWRPMKYRGTVYFRTFQENVVYFDKQKPAPRNLRVTTVG